MTAARSINSPQFKLRAIDGPGYGLLAGRAASRELLNGV